MVAMIEDTQTDRYAHYTPSLETVRSLAGQGNITPIYRELFADLETPVSAYLKVAQDAPNSFLLESVEGGERLARYSFMGTQPYLTLKLDKGVALARQNGHKQTINYTDPLEVISSYLKSYQLVEAPGLELPRFYGGAVGYLNYETVRYFEKLPSPDNDPLALPESIFIFVDTMLVFDHLKRKIKVVSHVHLDGSPSDIEQSYAEAVAKIERQIERLNGPVPTHLIEGRAEGYHDGPVTSNTSQAEYEARVNKAKEYIAAGDIIQVVPSQRLSRPTSAKSVNLYRALRAVNPSPYMYYLHFPELDIIGASPELLVQVDNGLVSTHPIAGTRKRGADDLEDAALAEELAADEKEIAEHVMLVDLGRNDIGRVSTPGTVKVTQLLDVEKYSHVMHLVSHVEGQLVEDMSAFDALRACFPAGTVSGAPKIRAMEIIAELEQDQRGLYAGSVGYFGYSGNLDTAIAIRTIVLKDGIAHVQAGGGVVADSDPATEYQESLNKARGMLRALDEAERLG